MKKVFFAILLLGLSVLLVSCSNKNKFKLDNSVENVLIIKNQYFGSSIIELSINLTGEELNEFKEKFNSIKHIASSGETDDYKFVISYSDVVIKVISKEKFVSEINGEIKVYKTTKNDFEFLYDYDFIGENIFEMSEFSDETVYYILNDELELDLSLNKKIINDFSKSKGMKVDDGEFAEVVCQIKFGEQLVGFIDETTVKIGDYYYYLDTKIDFDLVNEEGLKAFEDFGEFEKIEVTKTQAALTNEVSGKEEFINNLMLLEFLELNNSNDYNLGSTEYVINIGENKIEVYKDCFFKYNGSLYYVTAESFDFLDELKFNSTGWLPWV